jgi:hypothetical protein
VAYGARLEIVLGVKTLAGSNPASSATYQHNTGHHDRPVTSRTTASTTWPPRPDGTERESTGAD